MTQALFDIAYLDRFLDAVGGESPIPLLVGIWPVRSYELAFRLHNEVPGITIPDAVQTRLADAGPDAAAVGLELGARAARGVEAARGRDLRDPAVQGARGGARPPLVSERCAWAQGDELRPTTTRSGGGPSRTSAGLYERLCLEAFQSGLSWLTILRKREGFRRGVRGVRPGRGRAVRRERRRAAAWPTRRSSGTARRSRLRSRTRARWSRCGHRGPVRRARLVVRARHDGRAARRWRDLPAVTPESTALAKALKAHGFRFVGPTTAYALMQACGLVNDHVGDVLRARGHGRAPSSAATRDQRQPPEPGTISRTDPAQPRQTRHTFPDSVNVWGARSPIGGRRPRTRSGGCARGRARPS